MNFCKKGLPLLVFVALIFASCQKESSTVPGANEVDGFEAIAINDTQEPLLLSDPCAEEFSSQGEPGSPTSTDAYAEDDYEMSSEPEAGSGGGDSYGGQGTAGTITAGEVRDLVDWSYWQSIQPEFGETAEVWSMNPIKRFSVLLQDNTGAPLTDAQVLLTDDSHQDLWRAQTDNAGSAELWLDLYSDQAEGELKIVVFYNDVQFVIEDPIMYELGINQAEIPVNATKPMSADIMIAFDATGSMGDELEYIKTEVLDIFTRIKSSNPQMAFRFGSVFYKDYGDDYLSISTPLQEEINATAAFINDQHAAGGGDFPEAVHIALQDGIVGEDWAEKASTRILFLILDAPPHKDECTQKQMRLLVKEAARKGVKVIPITASGIDKETEYLMRFAALATNGTYSFITDHSGIGGDHIDPTTLGYEVEFLNDLMVRLVNRYVE